jgi:hypothetical protein
MWTDVSFDEARLRLRELTVTLARLGEAENALWRLLAASRKTQKRVNALKYNIIPRYQATVQHIRAALEEDERNTLFQIKVLRAASGFPRAIQGLEIDRDGVVERKRGIGKQPAKQQNHDQITHHLLLENE